MSSSLFSHSFSSAMPDWSWTVSSFACKCDLYFCFYPVSMLRGTQSSGLGASAGWCLLKMFVSLADGSAGPDPVLKCRFSKGLSSVLWLVPMSSPV